MSTCNLLTESWVPIKSNHKISLKQLLCENQKYELALDRDDMELACLQMLVCTVQVIFTPDDFEQLEDSYNEPMSKENYDKGIESFKDWFDLLHPQYPFMQTNLSNESMDIKKKKSLQKLLIGLPEKTSPSSSSNAHFHRPDEVKEMALGEVAIALFQQATNGCSLGGAYFSVGLKGSMPLTTLIYDKSRDLRKTIWCNILHKEFLRDKNMINDDETTIDEPSWVKAISFDKKNPEHTHQIGLMRGLFWQPARVKLAVSADGKKATGFFTENGPSFTKGYWMHPHTPMDMTKYSNDDEKQKPYMSLSFTDGALWTKMLGFLYAQQSDKEGHTRALAVDAYLDGIGQGKFLNLAVGGYIKGKSTESLFARKHEMYSLKLGFNEKYAEMKELMDYALNAQDILNKSIFILGQNLKWEFKDNKNSSQKREKSKGQEESNFIKKSLQQKAKKLYFNKSESLMHETLKNLDFDQIQKYKNQFCKLAKKVFTEVTGSYEHDPKFIKAIEKGHSHLFRKLQQ